MKAVRYIIMMMAVWMLTSCYLIMDYDDCTTETPKGQQHVVFSLRMEMPTRASWGDAYDSDLGTTFDNRIRNSALQVQIYTPDNRLMGEVENIMYWSQSETEYTFYGDISHLPLTQGNSYKIVVLANSPTASNDINSLDFSIDDIAYPDGYIPMVGILQYTITNASLQELGTIDMLRSVAKVVVDINSHMIADGYTLEEVSIDHHNLKGYCMPNGWNRVTRTRELDQELCINALHSHIEEQEGHPFAAITDGIEYVMYMPEFNVLHTADNRPAISLKLKKNGVVMTYNDAISFSQYDINGDPVPNSDYNIVRNHVYHYTITGISSNLILEYEVMPWEDGGTWDRGTFQYPTYHNPVIPDKAEYLENPMLAITTPPTMTYNTGNPEAGAFSVWFRMTEPVGQKWMPVVNQSDDDYDIKVYHIEDGLRKELTDSKQWVAADKWYNIKVIPRKAQKEGHTVNFGITYTQDWMPQHMSMYLFINGEKEKLAWPESGNSPQKIAIKQL